MSTRSRFILRFGVALALLVAAAIGFTGCALFQQGLEYPIQVTLDDWQGVRVTVDGIPSEVVDGTVILSKERSSHLVSFSRPGHHPASFYFERRLAGQWLLKDLIWGVFPLAWLVDISTGAVFAFEPGEIHLIIRSREEGEGAATPQPPQPTPTTAPSTEMAP